MKFILFIFSCTILLHCKGLSQENFEIVSTDVKNSRVFVALNSKHVVTDSEITTTITDVLAKLKSDTSKIYSNILNISLFSDKNFATYKPEDTKRFKKWKGSYLAEYTHNNKTLILHPMDFSKKKSIKLK